jgi:hypothetical protein
MIKSLLSPHSFFPARKSEIVIKTIGQKQVQQTQQIVTDPRGMKKKKLQAWE